MAHAVGALGAQPRTAAGRTGRLRLHGAGRRSPSSHHRRNLAGQEVVSGVFDSVRNEVAGHPRC